MLQPNLRFGFIITIPKVWHIYFKGSGMIHKDLFFKLLSLPMTRDILNSVLRYIMAQPVEMDFMVLILLVVEYTGISKLLNILHDGESARQNSPSDELFQAS
jgi:hypothetical protein